jgi:hypothetical protein
MSVGLFVFCSFPHCFTYLYQVLHEGTRLPWGGLFILLKNNSSSHSEEFLLSMELRKTNKKILAYSTCMSVKVFDTFNFPFFKNRRQFLKTLHLR